MNPRAGVALFVVCLLGTALFWWLQPSAGPPAEPAPTEAPKRPIVFPDAALPKVAPRVYSFPRAPEPAAPLPKPAPQQPLSRETHQQLARATTTAMGAGYQDCVRPWLEADVVDEDAPTEPLVVFFDMVDGRLSDVRLRSPIEIPRDVVTCFADAVWDEGFPEDPDHRGSISVQRVIPIRK